MPGLKHHMGSLPVAGFGKPAYNAQILDLKSLIVAWWNSIKIVKRSISPVRDILFHPALLLKNIKHVVTSKGPGLKAIIRFALVAFHSKLISMPCPVFKPRLCRLRIKPNSSVTCGSIRSFVSIELSGKSPIWKFSGSCYILSIVSFSFLMGTFFLISIWSKEFFQFPGSEVFISLHCDVSILLHWNNSMFSSAHPTGWEYLNKHEGVFPGSSVPTRYHQTVTPR